MFFSLFILDIYDSDIDSDIDIYIIWCYFHQFQLYVTHFDIYISYDVIFISSNYM